MQAYENFETVFKVFSNTPFKKITKQYVTHLHGAYPEYKKQADWICSVGLKYLYNLLGTGSEVLEKLGTLYIKFIMDYMKEYQNFIKTSTYVGMQKGFHKINNEIYQNDEYMQSYLLPMLFSYAFFPHHYKEFLYFKSTVQDLQKDAKCIDFGCGHGLFSLSLLRESNRICECVDISPSSVRMTSLLLKHFVDSSDSYSCTVSDVTTYEPKRDNYDFFVLAGLLEHMEKPDIFLKSIAPFLDDRGLMFIMLPVNVPLPDHIIHFKDVLSVELFLKECELKITDSKIIYADMAAHKDLDKEKPQLIHLSVCRKNIL